MPGPATSATPTGDDADSPGIGSPSSGREGADGGTTGPEGTGGADLHTHSIFSDGSLSPADLIREAAGAGLRALALTDHDTLDGLPEAEAAAASFGLDFVPGVELSTGGEDGTGEVHLLGYLIDRDDPDLLAGLTAYAKARLDRLNRIAARLAEFGIQLDPARVRQLAGPGTVGRPHIARALVESGHAADLGDAFDRFLANGRPAFVPRPKVEPEQGIALIRAAGGVPVLAHPLGVGDVAATVARLVPAGLAGLEVDYGAYDDATRAQLRAIADRWGLIATGGSDFHGPSVRAERQLGRPPVPLAAVARLRDAAAAARPVRGL